MVFTYLLYLLKTQLARVMRLRREVESWTLHAWRVFNKRPMKNRVLFRNLQHDFILPPQHTHTHTHTHIYIYIYIHIYIYTVVGRSKSPIWRWALSRVNTYWITEIKLKWEGPIARRHATKLITFNFLYNLLSCHFDAQHIPQSRCALLLNYTSLLCILPHFLVYICTFRPATVLKFEPKTWSRGLVNFNVLTCKINISKLRFWWGSRGGGLVPHVSRAVPNSTTKVQ